MPIRRPKNWQPSGRDAEFGFRGADGEQISADAERFEDAQLMDLVEGFMKVHQTMEEIDQEMSVRGNVTLGLVDELEVRAHKFYDAIEMLRGVIRFREEVGV
jgi:hypothetical protein